MSVLIESSKYTKEQLDTIRSELVVRLEKGPTVLYIEPYAISGSYHILPYSYARQELFLEPPKRSSFPTMDKPFIGSLRPEQIKFKKDVGELLSIKGVAVGSAHIGFGKTVCAISLAATIRLKTLIVINKLMLFDQWIESIHRFIGGAKVQKLKPGTPLDPEADFYIVNAQNISKFNYSQLKKIGFVIVDEAHLIMAESLHMSLNHLFPRYLLALTATPYRPDNLVRLLDLFFGKDQIVVKMWRPFTVFKVETGLKIEHNGKEWNKVLGSQSDNLARNELILRLVLENPSRNILIMVKRVNHGEILYRMIKDAIGSTEVTKLLRNNHIFDKNARILIGTTQKMGTGFDHPKMDTLILASDIKEFFIQYLGRIFRRKDSDPIVFDLVDNHGILLNHYKQRVKVYKEHGGTIRFYSPQEFSNSEESDPEPENATRLF